ncbi:MAG: glycosyltransferase family 4 protein [Acidobacteria bacterium]|nr:glycosyltransferase family 4 protein [Acidobacteriota bacterium]
MRIILVSNYFPPETVGAGIWVHQLACDLRDRGHQVTVLTGFPSYPQGKVFAGYRGGVFRREEIDGIQVIRTYTYATPSKRFWPRFLSFGSFCASSLIGGLAARQRADVVYAILPPLPLGISAWAMARAAGARLVVNVQDIYPDIAVAMGFLRNRRAIAFFRRMERWIYRAADRVVVVSDGFRRNLESKGVPANKIAVVPNWADPRAIRPGPRENSFRRELGINGEFVVLYSGGLSHNSHLDPVLEAARRLKGDGILFLIAGEGVHKARLERQARESGLASVRFLPFQPLERYPEMLAAADATLVTLHPAAACASLPSKIYKQMAAARPIVALAPPESDLARLVETGRCGWSVPCNQPEALARVLRQAARDRQDCARRGANGRAYLERECSRSFCVAAIEQTLS